MPLDIRGNIAAGQVAFYVPIAIISFIFVFKYAFRRDAGWLFLGIFALVRITGGALILAGELMPKPNPDLFLAAYILFPAGLSILMLSSLGFLGLAGQHTYSEYTRTTHALRVLGLLALAGLGLSLAGGILGSPVRPEPRIGMILRRAAAGVYAGLFVLLLIGHFLALGHRYLMRSYRRNLLYGLILALPFLGARAAYGVLDAWSASDQFGTNLTSNPAIQQFNSLSGKWLIYLLMGLVSEFLVAALFLFAGLVLGRRHRRR